MKKKLLMILTLLICFCLTSCKDDVNKVIEEEKNYNPTNETVTIIFENNDGSIISNDILKYGDSINIPKDFEKSDSPRYTYTFVGWDLNGDNEVDQIPDKATSSFVAKAIYEYSLNKYEVEFVPNCDTYSGKLIDVVGYGQSAVAPTDLVKEGYDFVSWDKAYDYITGKTVVSALWERHKFTIHLNGFEKMNINYIDDYKVEAFYGYANSLPVPNRILDNLVFNGWKDENGKMITNEFGDILEPLNSNDDMNLQLDYSLVELNGIYTLSEIHRNEITDEDLISRLNNYVETSYITSEYFYYNNDLYYMNEGRFEHGYLIDYINLGIDDTIWYFDDSPDSYVFISVDVIDFSTASDYQTTLDKFKNDTKHGSNLSSVCLPYAREIKEIMHDPSADESSLDCLLYDKDNNCYRKDVSENMHVFNDETYDLSTLTYLVSRTNRDSNTPYQYTNASGIVGTIENDVLYGIRYVLSGALQKRG